MTLSNARATFGLNASATPTSQGVSGTVQIGASNSSFRFPDATVAHVLRGVFAGSSDELVLNLTTGSTTGSTTWVAGNAQVETATAAGTISTAGNATAIVTSAGMSGSPLTVTFAVALSDTGTLWAAKARTALAANATIAARFEVVGTGTAVGLKRLPLATYDVPGGTLDIFAANDGTLNIALADDTSAGITEAATSANTTAGVASDGVRIYDGDGNDFEGVTLPVISTLNGLMIRSEDGPFLFTGVGNDDFTMGDDEVHFRAAVGGITYEASCSFTASGPGALTITIIGQPA